MPNLLGLKSIVESFLRCNNRSEAEVRSKLVVPLIEWLEYPIEFRAEEFPVYGFEGSRKIPTKHADFLLFNDKDYKSHDQFRAEHIEWVQKHSLLVLETKKPGEMPNVLGQPQFYSIWTKAVAYIITDGVHIKGYVNNPISADMVVINCDVKDLFHNQDICNFAYSSVNDIKAIDWAKEIERRISDRPLTNIYTISEEVELPKRLITYLLNALGKDAIGLSNSQMLEKYLQLTNTYLQQNIRYNIPQYMYDIPRQVTDAWIFLDDSLIPYMSGSVYRYYWNEYEKLEFQNEYLMLRIHLFNDVKIEFDMAFAVLDYHASERIYNLQRIEKIYKAKSLKIQNKQDGRIIRINLDDMSRDGANIPEQLALISYWQNCMQKIKTIEEYYGISLYLSPVLTPEESDELYNSIEVVYNGIAKERNIRFCEEGERCLSCLATDEPISLQVDGLFNLSTIKIHNYMFRPTKMNIIPHENSTKISIEFIPLKISNNNNAYSLE